MWALPNIQSMNESAVKGKQSLLRTFNKKRMTCDHCDKQATERYLVYDIFSNDPKSISAYCSEHDQYRHEDIFYCQSCECWMALNYTWELYNVQTEDGELCLPCHANNILEDFSNWIDLTNGEIDALDFNQVQQSKHLIGVEMPVPAGIELVDCVTFDSSSGGRVTGFSSAESTPDGGVEELKGYLKQAEEEGAARAILILDGGYQFATRIGVYKPVEGGEYA